MDDDDRADPKTWPRARKLAWCKERAADVDWPAAANSMIQDMTLLDIPLSADAIALGMLEGMSRGERGVRDWIDSIQ